MGQLEKYGLYVLCLLIFLILGVTLWGSGNAEAFEKGAKSSTQHLKAAGGSSPVTGRPSTNDNSRARIDRSEGGVDRGKESQRTEKLPSFAELLNPAAPPKKPAREKVPGDDPNKQPNEPQSGTANAGEQVAPPPKVPAVVERPTYTIRRGDNYEAIAREQFGRRALASEIARVNPRQDPRKLRPGRTIALPTKAEIEAFVGKRAAKRAGVKAGGSYTIRRGDTFTSIAIEQLGSRKRVTEIQALNPGVDPGKMRIGATILLPQK